MIKPYKYRKCLTCLAEASYTNKIFIYQIICIRLSEIMKSKNARVFGKCFDYQILF